MWTEVKALKDALALIDGVTSCQIGVEKNIGPASYPMIRIVPERVTPGKYKDRTVECGIYFGVNVTESEGLEKVYEDLSTLERSIIAALKEAGGRYIETITDEDRLDTYKLMFIRCEISSARPIPPA